MHKHTRARNRVQFVTLRRLLLTSVVVGLPYSGAALGVQATDVEMAFLPHYCAYAQGFKKQNTTEGKRLWAQVGEQSFKHIHHYCWGLLNLQRARESSATARQQKQFLLKTVTADFNYSINRSAKGFVLLPEMLSRSGEVYLLRSLPDEADKEFSRARALKPDYWPAYSHWVEFLIYSGKLTEARQLIKSGLKYSPNSRVLREQYRLLSSDPSKHESADKVEKASTPPSKQRPNRAKAATDASPASSVE